MGDQHGLFDPPPPNSGTNTSRAAAASMEQAAPVLREQVFDAIAAAPDGLTCEELCEALDLPGDTVRPRLWELRGQPKKAQRPVRIMDSGETRKTKRGRKATVWRVA